MKNIFQTTFVCFIAAGVWLGGCANGGRMRGEIPVDLGTVDDSPSAAGEILVPGTAENKETSAKPADSSRESKPDAAAYDGADSASSEAQDRGKAQMTAVVKETEEGCLLVSSRTDEFPGAYYVYSGDLDISGIKGGDEVLIFWDGLVLETDPAQIYADAIEFK